MTRRYRILLLFVTFLVAVTGCYVTFEESRPTGKESYKDKRYYKQALVAIECRRRHVPHGCAIGRFKAGWSSRIITPPEGTPLAGFGARKGKRSTGVHDELFVKALAVSDGIDMAVIVGADMLLVPENIADLVRARVSEQTELTANDILFNLPGLHVLQSHFVPRFNLRISNMMCNLILRMYNSLQYRPTFSDILPGIVPNRFIFAHDGT